jgi:hypothetical protein
MQTLNASNKRIVLKNMKIGTGMDEKHELSTYYFFIIFELSTCYIFDAILY